MAVILKGESLHQKAIAKYTDYKQNRVRLITSTYVLDELFTRCLYRAGSHGAKMALSLINQAISNNELEVLDIDSQIFKKSQDVFLKFSDQKISFTDATSVCLYKDFALDEIFTLDKDFKKFRINTSF